MSPRQREAIDRTKDGPDGWAIRGETHTAGEGLLKGSEPGSKNADTVARPGTLRPLFADDFATEYGL